MNKSYSYIVLNASSSIFTAVNTESRGDGPHTLNFFSSNGDITNGNNKSVSANIGYAYGAFPTIAVNGTSVVASGGFKRAEQRSDLTCTITCQLTFKAYMS